MLKLEETAHQRKSLAEAYGGQPMHWWHYLTPAEREWMCRVRSGVRNLLDLIYVRAYRRKMKCEPLGISVSLLVPDFMYLTQNELSRVHDLKMLLPSHSEESLAARERLKIRRGL
jgi:hypothetical protein